MEEKKKSKVGRPTKYEERFIEECYKFFDKELYTIIKKQVAGQKGMFEIEEREPNMMPTIEGFACHLRLHKDTIYDWAKQEDKKDFSDALDFGRQKMKEFLNYHALMGNYNSGYAKFFAINATDMVEKKEVEVTGEGAKITIDINDAGL